MLIAACIIVPQVMVVFLSPLAGSLAQRWGRRPLLLIGFAALPLKGLCFGLIRDPDLFVAAQCLDGVSAAIIGVLVPLVAADATRLTGRFALAQGLIGTGMGLGASISTLLAGYLADKLGSATAFFGLAGVGAIAFVIIVATMPETRPLVAASGRRTDPRKPGPR
jgi:MFS family permease